MTALGFMKQFAGPVEARVKRQTIRADASRFKIGAPIQLYTGMRTKGCRKLVAEDPVCISIIPISIPAHAGLIAGRIKMGEYRLSPVECIDMAHLDGFASYRDFCRFFADRAEMRAGSDRLRFYGFLIRWDWPSGEGGERP